MTLSGQSISSSASAPSVDTASRLTRWGVPGWLVRLLVCHLLPVWCLLVWCLLALGAAPAGAASAAPTPSKLEPAADAAPMCDPMGASVAAQPEIPEVDGGRLEELPCEALLLMTSWRLDAPELGSKAALHDPEPHQPQSFQHYRARYDGACDFSVGLPGRGEPLVMDAPLRDGLRARSGHELGVYRPPVARV
jgi:hypothetical protein